MSMSKQIKEWIAQVDAISEELAQIDLDCDMDIAHDNCSDMLISIKTEMQEVLDTEYTNGGGS